MNAKLRQTLYFGGSIVTGILGIALIWGGIDAGAADNLNSIFSGLVTLLGGTAPTAVAGAKVKEQRKDGTLSGVPLGEVFQTIVALKTVVDDTVDYAQNAASAATSTLQSITNMIPGQLGGASVGLPVTPGVVGDLFQDVAAQWGPPQTRQ